MRQVCRPYRSFLDKTSFEPTIDGLVIPRELLPKFAAAIAGFWKEAEYIYMESIERKHPSLEVALAKMRDARANRRSSP